MDELQQYYLVLKRRWLPASTVFMAVLALTSVMTYKQKSVYEAKGQVLLKRTNSTSSLTGVGKPIGELESVGGTNPTTTQAELIRSIPVIEETIATLELSQKPEAFLSHLSVTNIKATDLLEVAYKDTDPKRAAAVVNRLMAVYSKNDVSAQRAEAQAAREFVEKQLPKTEVSVERAEEALSSFKERNHVIDLKAEATSTVEVLKGLDQDMTSTQTQLESETARVASLRQMFGMSANEAVVAGFFDESPTTQKVLADLHEVQQRLEIERISLTDAHPTIIKLRSEEVTLKGLLQDRLAQSVVGNQQPPAKVVELRNQGVQQKLIEDFANAEAQRASLQRRQAALSDIEAAHRQRASILPQLEKQQRQLERQLEAAQSTYNLLLAKLQEIRVAENQTVGNARIVAPASTSQEAIAPRKAQNLATGTLGGILLAVATALLLEATDKSIKSTEAAKELLGCPLLGIITAFHRHQKQLTPEVIVRNTPSCPVSEAFRMLQTNLRLSNRQLKVLVVASSAPQEGKSTIAANLAVATAQLGRRVLLVDGDMRQPTQHQIWDIPNEVGLSSVLLGRSELNRAVTEVMPNLDVLPAGEATSNPVALLDSNQMAVLIASVSQSYDFVIVDTPPLTVAADATILGNMGNGVLLVVRPGVSDAANVALSKELLVQSGQKVLGLVMNGVAPSSQSNSYYSRGGVEFSNSR